MIRFVIYILLCKRLEIVEKIPFYVKVISNLNCWNFLIMINDLINLIMLGNGPFYGGPFDVFPAAQLDDGKVDAIIAERVQKWRTPEYLWGVLTGNLRSLKGVHYVQAERIDLAPADGERVAVQLDGDAAGELPAKISVAAGGLRVVAPLPAG